MIDLHLHVLPGVDDGAETVNVARAMLSMLSKMGFKRLVATPHLMDVLTPEYHQLTTSALDQMRPIAEALGIALDLGYEHLLSPGLARRLQGGEPSTLAGSSAVLVELPFIGWPQHTSSSLFELRTAAYRPVLAHPERYVEVHKNPELALAAGEQGAVLQITSGSLAGLYGKSVERSAKKLLELGLNRDLRFVLSTDAHSEGQRLTQAPNGLDWIRRHLGSGQLVVEWMSQIVPEHLLASEPIPGFQEWAQGRSGTSASMVSTAARPRSAWRRALGRTSRR
jgi:protein-tyrosine phosphatase